jgi:hypothetical protein
MVDQDAQEVGAAAGCDGVSEGVPLAGLDAGSLTLMVRWALDDGNAKGGIRRCQGWTAPIT